MQAAPAQGLVDACGESPGTVCEWVWDRTGNETLSKLSDWLIGRPLTVLVIVLVAWIVSRIARRYIRRAIVKIIVTDRSAAARALEKVGVPTGSVALEDPRRQARATSIATVVTSTVTVLIWVIALLMIIGELGINLAPLIAGAGIAGVAIGFGAQTLVRDCITGLFMLIEDQYGIGDTVDLGLATGSVEQITLRTTVVRGGDGTVWHVPNGEIRRVGNSSKLWSAAILDVEVAYDADLALVERVVLDVAERMCADERYSGDVQAAPELLGVESVSPTTVTLRLKVKTNPGANHRIQRALREEVKLALDEAGVNVLPPPART